MKLRILYVLTIVTFIGCSDDDMEIVGTGGDDPVQAVDNCESVLQEVSAVHPNSISYQSILDEYTVPEALVGSLLLVRDGDGYWIGSSGKADLENDIDMQPCDVAFIASISKVFTAVAVYRYIDQNLLSLDDMAKIYLDEGIVANIANLDEVTVGQLLSHTSGIPDFITDQYGADRFTSDEKLFTNENILEYIYGEAAENAPGERYSYTNTNFALLSLVLEGASGKELETIYQEEIFDVLDLSSAYYGEGESIIPSSAVEGYVDIENDGSFVNSKFLYREEIGTGGDSGIAINTYDLARFFERLLRGELISPSSLGQMTTYIDIPEDEQVEAIGQFQNGFGIERYDLPFGTALGHTGLIDGFSSFSFYFPEEDYTVILINNSASLDGAEAQVGILTELFQTIFQ